MGVANATGRPAASRTTPAMSTRSGSVPLLLMTTTLVSSADTATATTERPANQGADTGSAATCSGDAPLIVHTAGAPSSPAPVTQSRPWASNDGRASAVANRGTGRSTRSRHRSSAPGSGASAARLAPSADQASPVAPAGSSGTDEGAPGTGGCSNWTSLLKSTRRRPDPVRSRPVDGEVLDSLTKPNSVTERAGPDTSGTAKRPAPCTSTVTPRIPDAAISVLVSCAHIARRLAASPEDAVGESTTVAMPSVTDTASSASFTPSGNPVSTLPLRYPGTPASWARARTVTSRGPTGNHRTSGTRVRLPIAG